MTTTRRTLFRMLAGLFAGFGAVKAAPAVAGDPKSSFSISNPVWTHARIEIEINYTPPASTIQWACSIDGVSFTVLDLPQGAPEARRVAARNEVSLAQSVWR